MLSRCFAIENTSLVLAGKTSLEKKDNVVLISR